MFLSNLNSFFLPLHRWFKGLIKGRVLPGCGRKMAPSDSITFLSIFLFLLASLVCVLLYFWVSLVLCFTLFNMFLFDCFSVLFILFIFFFKFEKSEKYKNSVYFVYIGTCVSWMTIETKFSKLCIICSLDEHLYAQLSKWALWLLFVMSKIKLFLILNTHITLFNGKD